MREKLHQIIAPYLGDPDYPLEERRLAEAAARGVGPRDLTEFGGRAAFLLLAVGP